MPSETMYQELQQVADPSKHVAFRDWLTEQIHSSNEGRRIAFACARERFCAEFEEELSGGAPCDSR